MPASLAQKYAELRAVAANATADIDTVNEIMIDILQLLHDRFAETTGSQKIAYEQAYSYLDYTVSAHRATKQDTSNQFYLNEVGLQVGRDISSVLSKVSRQQRD